MLYGTHTVFRNKFEIQDLFYISFTLCSKSCIWWTQVLHDVSCKQVDCTSSWMKPLLWKSFMLLVLREILGEEDWELDKRLLRLSNWLNVPVYMYVYRSADESASMNSSQRCLWTKYEPDNSLPHSEVACRFYVTLFLNQMKNSFDRIVSLRGCNCEIPPPQSLLRNCNCK